MENLEKNIKQFNKAIKEVYEAYPMLKRVDNNNGEILRKNIVFKNIFANEYLKTAEGSCGGFILVIKGNINIHRINQEGNETNLYNIGRGDICHEALSCFLNCQSLNIVGKAIQDSLVAIIPPEIVKEYFLRDKNFVEEIYKDLYVKFKLVIENKEARSHESIEHRLIKLLISKKSNIIYGTQSELAFQIDSAREVVSRKLKDIERRGYIKVMRGKIQIVGDLKELLN
ncbi:MAG: Crp/Fnr family transcriptional regulator [Clostridium sp.]|uniref:Crp/Fnr family transcriptional regulator n=1 Tax=Clostridium sp. TaxID=1506 RepID=UPI00301FC506